MNYNDEKYIKVSDLKEKYKWWCDTPSGQRQYKEICDCVDAVPAADVQEVKHAHWEALANGYGFVCSNCRVREKRSAVINGTHKFCYKCGAKMDGKGRK